MDHLSCRRIIFHHRPFTVVHCPFTAVLLQAELKTAEARAQAADAAEQRTAAAEARAVLHQADARRARSLSSGRIWGVIFILERRGTSHLLQLLAPSSSSCIVDCCLKCATAAVPGHYYGYTVNPRCDGQVMHHATGADRALEEARTAHCSHVAEIEQHYERTLEDEAELTLAELEGQVAHLHTAAASGIRPAQLCSQLRAARRIRPGRRSRRRRPVRLVPVLQLRIISNPSAKLCPVLCLGPCYSLAGPDDYGRDGEEGRVARAQVLAAGGGGGRAADR